jgi:UDP-N-acetylmuramyl tripeptide synthase
MGLFGRTSCREDRSWRVIADTVDNERIVLTEQLNEEEATKFLKELEEQFEDKKKTIKVIKDGGDNYYEQTWIINKRNVVCFKLHRY